MISPLLLILPNRSFVCRLHKKVNRPLLWEAWAGPSLHVHLNLKPYTSMYSSTTLPILPKEIQIKFLHVHISVYYEGNMRIDLHLFFPDVLI
nr:hypothetical 10.7K protein - Marek's disease virus [Gallid alphaherpesvirus 2]